MVRVPLLLGWMYFAATLAGQTPVTHGIAELLPSGARIIETARVPVHAAKARVLVLWMKAPRRVMSSWDSAADLVYGDHWFGPAFLSLIDPSAARLLNTVTIHGHQESPDDNGGFAIPIFTYNFSYYVPHPGKDRKGKPLLLYLRDLTGEGVAGQFVLFAPVVSGISAGSVFGYSSRSDSAVQYAVERTQNGFNPVVQLWALQVFDSKPLRAGHWKFTWEPGHGEWVWIDEQVHFDPERQLFVEKLTTRPYPGFGQVHCDLDAASLPKFLALMRNVAPDEIDTGWLQNLIGKTPPNSIAAAGMVPAFNGNEEPLSFEFQVSAGGAIGIEFTTDARFAASLRERLQTWCPAN